MAVGAHPDDVELCVGGTIIKEVQAGTRVVVVDLTAGELGTRGSAKERLREAECAAQVMGVAERLCLHLPDGFFQPDRESILKLVEVIRRFRPDVVLFPAPYERHPDHERAHRLVREALFLAGLRRIETGGLEPFRPSLALAYIQFYELKPDVIVDISDVWDRKLEAIRCYRSQFDPSYPAPTTILSERRFMAFLEGRARHWGAQIGVEFGEGLVALRPLGVVRPSLLI